MRLSLQITLFLSFVSIPSMVMAQSEGTLTGVIYDAGGKPAANVTVRQIKSDHRSETDSSGKYVLLVDAGKQIVELSASWIPQPKRFEVNVAAGQIMALNDTLDVVDDKALDVKEVEIKDQSVRYQAGAMKLDVSNANLFPSASNSVEGMLKVLTGDNNELSSQYKVRGGNYDENLVYVNDFEIYRPFLVRSGQQEGLSFVNPNMVGGLTFSVGGFQAKYGDKMSSVLDVNYIRPDSFQATVMASLLGYEGTLAGASKNKKFTFVVSAREKSNKYLLKSQPTKGQYSPSFTDVQALLNYKFSDKFEVEAIGNFARNRFTFNPENSSEAFGYLMEAYKLVTSYTGGEKDQFDTRYGGVSATWKPAKNVKLKWLATGFQTNEFETYDISGEYGLYAVETDLGKNTGEEKWSLGTGIQHQFARNFLTANVITASHKGSAALGTHVLLWGFDFQHVSVNDQLLEWERRDSAGYSQPYSDDNIYMNYVHRADNDLSYNRLSGYLQDNIRLGEKSTLSVGLRGNYSFLSKEMVWSPRVQFGFSPANWDKNVVFRISAGIYAQPPFYREMRDWEGNLNTKLKAQKTAHFSAGFDYDFIAMGDHKFKLMAEAYYKNLWDLVPYQYDNVRIRYYPQNSAKGYSYGAEVRLFGEVVKDAESWISIAYLKTMQKIFDSTTNAYGPYMPRPTDQRLAFGMYFSDYLPMNHNFKMYLNLMYSTGLPYAPMGKYEPGYIFRIPDYKRVDVGFAALLLDGEKHKHRAHSLFKGVKSIWASFEVLNLLGIMNTISYTWIQNQASDGGTGYFAVPNRLTARLPNLKIIAKF